jgi:hypothetical protein
LGGAFKAISYNFLKNSLIADTGVIVPVLSASVLPFLVSQTMEEKC